MAKNEALSAFLTAKRAAVSPASAGITTHGQRRVPGLRREEVAFLAGVSADWYIRLEQGRQVRPSESVLDAIARILNFDDAEREYLHNLARPATGIRRPSQPRPVRPGIAKMLSRLDNQAGFVLGPRMEVLAGNDLAWALLADFPRRASSDRNLLRWVILDPAARDLYVEWRTVASELVGVLQLEASASPGDQEIENLVRELLDGSADFRVWWSRQNPQGRTSGVKNFRHPIAGALRIEWEAFVVPDDSAQTLFVYTAADPASDDALKMLAAWRATEVAASRGAG